MLALLIALACAPKTNAPEPLPDDDGIDWTREALKMHMSEHYTRIADARKAAISGDIGTAKDHLGWLAEHDTFEGVPENWGGWMQHMRTYASFGANSERPEDIGRSMGAIGVQCGGCHQSLNVTPNVPEASEVPQATAGVRGHAARHGWAADRLWSAIIMPSEAAWRDSLFALREPAMDITSFELDEAQLAAAAPFVDAMSQLSAAGNDYADPVARAATFGHVVHTCTGCHNATVTTE